MWPTFLQSRPLQIICTARVFGLIKKDDMALESGVVCSTDLSSQMLSSQLEGDRIICRYREGSAKLGPHDFSRDNATDAEFTKTGIIFLRS
ncbi:hypothetical protein Tco_0328725 [Tanacetum coccineum]